MNRIDFIPDNYFAESYSKERFAKDILAGLGLNSTPERMLFMLSWFQAEGMLSSAENVAYNPLATTWKMPGSTNYNCLKKDAAGNCLIGVQDYPDYATGLAATLKTLKQETFYPAIRKALQDNVKAINEEDPGLKHDFGLWGTTYNLFKKVYASKGGKVLPGTNIFAPTNNVQQMGILDRKLIKPLGILTAMFTLGKIFDNGKKQ